VMDQVIAIERNNDALAYDETGRAKGKVVVPLKWRLGTNRGQRHLPLAALSRDQFN
jgi:hypothetical protein